VNRPPACDARPPACDARPPAGDARRPDSDAPRGAIGTACRARFADGRSHFQHGPIDLVIGADGDPQAVADALDAAWLRFQRVLAELVTELPLLRQPVAALCVPRGPVALRMHAACLPHLPRFITPMAAVAGAVADETIAYFRRPGIERAYVNNGGDIAFHVADGGRPYRIGVSERGDPADALSGEPMRAGATVGAGSAAGGIATSGWRGRSQSLGIADSVTVIARSASFADAAATLIANAVDVEDDCIVRRQASSLRADSDLADRLVTVHVPELGSGKIEAALAAGAFEAHRLIESGLAVAAMLSLQGRRRAIATHHATHREAA
jgi:uncharacterized protein